MIKSGVWSAQYFLHSNWNTVHLKLKISLLQIVETMQSTRWDSEGQINGLSTNKYYGGNISVSYYWFYNFPNQFIWFYVWICIACFLYHMFSLFFCAVKWIRKDVPTKLKKYLFHLRKIENDSEFFWTDKLLCWLCCRTGTMWLRA